MEKFPEDNFSKKKIVETKTLKDIKSSYIIEKIMLYKFNS